MDCFSRRKDPRQLIMAHARPMADTAGIKMNEGRVGCRVIADAATLHPQPDIANGVDGNVRQIKIHRLAEHMLGIFRDRLRPATQHGIGFGRTIPRNNMDRVLRADLPVRLPDNIEEAGVHARRLVATPVPQEPVQFFKGIAIKTAIILVSNSQRFLGMHVLERQGPRLAIGNRIANTCRAQHQGADRSN